MQPWVSVIIPVYNRCSFCDAAVEILKKQTLEHIEFIIVDDGSTDGTYDKLCNLTGGDARFVIIRQNENSGPSDARNRALELVRGDYVGFFDIDDEIPAEYFESLYKQAKDSCADVVFGSYNGLKHYKTGLVSEMAEKISSLRNGALWDKLFSADIIKQNSIRFPSGLYCADNVFVFKCFYYAKSVFLTNTPVYDYKLAPDSISTNIQKSEKRKKDIIKIIDLFIEFIKLNGLRKDSLTETFHFLNRSFNQYVKDSDFQKDFNTKVGLISRDSRVIISQRKDKMLWLKIQRFFGLISRARYNDKVLRRRVVKSGLFDEKWYLIQYPDVAKAKMDAVKHYMEFGWKEGRNPSTKFDTKGYLHDYPDVAQAGICPLLHYVDFGYKEGRYVRSVTGQVTVNEKFLVERKTFGDKMRYALEYPIRVREEYERLKAEIKDLQK